MDGLNSLQVPELAVWQGGYVSIRPPRVAPAADFRDGCSLFRTALHSVSTYIATHLQENRFT